MGDQMWMFDEEQRTLPRAAVVKFIESLGFDPQEVREMYVTPHGITVEYYALDEDGKKQISPVDRNELWTGTKTFKIEDRDA